MENKDIQLGRECDTLTGNLQFRNAAGDPVEQLEIRLNVDHAAGFVSLLLNMKEAASSHDAKYGTGVDRNTVLALEGLATMVELAFNVDEEDLPTDMLGDVIAFHEKFDLAYHGKPRSLFGVKDDVGADLGEFRLKFAREEVDEYEDEQEALNLAIADYDEDEVTLRLHKQIDALLDGVYVLLGTSYLQFGPRVVKEAWKRIQRANMAKVRATDVSQSKRGSLFDVIKPEGWVEPDHRDLVTDHAHKVFRKEGELNPGYKNDTQAVR